MLRQSLILGFGLLIVGCGTLKIQSQPPESVVYLETGKNKERKNLGKTPLSVDLSDIKDAVSTGPVMVWVERPGYQPYSMIIPNLGNGTWELSINLKPNVAGYEEINRIVAHIMKAERMLMQKRFDEALQVAADIKKINENIASAYEIEGAAYYAKRDLLKSRHAWQRVIDFEPENHEAKKFVQHLNEALRGSGTAN